VERGTEAVGVLPRRTQKASAREQRLFTFRLIDPDAYFTLAKMMTRV